MPSPSPAAIPILSKLGVLKNCGNGWSAKCPSHDDKNASLTVAETRSTKSGRPMLLLKCHGPGCTIEQITAALGISVKDLFLDGGAGSAPAAPKVPPRGPQTPSRPRSAEPVEVGRREYRLLDTSGELVAVHHRIDLADGKKQMWYSRNGTKGLDGLPTNALPLYGSERVAGWLAGEFPHTPVLFLVEGEKAAESLWARNIPAVATACGASVVPAAPILECLLPFEIFLWADADEPGRRHMNAIGALLNRMGNCPGVIQWPDAPPKGDAADYTGDVWALCDSAVIWGDGEPDPDAYGDRVIAEFEKRGDGQQQPELVADRPRKAGGFVPL